MISREERTPGTDHPDTLLTLQGLASAYGRSGRPANDVIKLLEAVREKQAKNAATSPADKLTTLNSLAGEYKAIGRTADAINLFTNVLKQRTTLLGGDHPDTLATMKGLALAYQIVGRQAEAISLFERWFLNCRPRQSAVIIGIRWKH